ncbi:MAG: GYD domain-containing protein [Deltaproteobacteria bacterium]|nr:MAG: GYD domain-containing protein [Deltaproteobacteria bacterium]
MPTYIGLFRLTEQGIKEIAKSPARLEDAAKLYQKMGGKVIGTYMVMGEYDYVAIGECPSDEIQAAYALALGSQGNVKTVTLKAFPANEIQAIFSKMPKL